MSVQLDRTIPQAGRFITAQTSGNILAHRYYSQTYITGTTQEWIYTPDYDTVGVTISFPDAGSAVLECTDAPPDVIDGGSLNAAQIYQWPAGVVSATTSTTVRGMTAFRVNRSSAGSNRVIVDVVC